jgi:hypothetical protein
MGRHGDTRSFVARRNVNGNEFPGLAPISGPGDAKFIRVVADDLAGGGQLSPAPRFAGDINDALRDVARTAEHNRMTLVGAHGNDATGTRRDLDLE